MLQSHYYYTQNLWQINSFHKIIKYFCVRNHIIIDMLPIKSSRFLSHQSFLTSTQPVSKLLTSLLCKLHISQIPLLTNLDRSGIFYFQPTWSEVCFLFPTSCREVGFENSVQLGQNYFFAFFIKAVLKMAFLLATTGRSFFWDYSPKRQSHRLPLGETFWKIADKARIKTLFSAATIWERLWTKYCSHRLPLERKFFCARYECECFFWRYMKIVFQNPLINRS